MQIYQRENKGFHKAVLKVVVILRMIVPGVRVTDVLRHWTRTDVYQL